MLKEELERKVAQNILCPESAFTFSILNYFIHNQVDDITLWETEVQER